MTVSTQLIGEEESKATRENQRAVKRGGREEVMAMQRQGRMLLSVDNEMCVCVCVSATKGPTVSGLARWCCWLG
ncbi:hypothetical protein LZ32DRAFT_612032 [Colletotrichum eremochloae]|nr:hypothetical protein LZ32DRAFT_612032 [Colletotrichum eremochloae]